MTGINRQVTFLVEQNIFSGSFLHQETERKMKFEIFDYDLQAEGVCGDLRWMFNNGNLWVYKDWEDAEYEYRIETDVQIEPFSTEKEIERVVRGVVLNCLLPLPEHRLSWKASMKKKKILSEGERMMIALWAKKLKEDFEKPSIFEELINNG